MNWKIATTAGFLLSALASQSIQRQEATILETTRTHEMRGTPTQTSSGTLNHSHITGSDGTLFSSEYDNQEIPGKPTVQTETGDWERARRTPEGDIKHTETIESIVNYTRRTHQASLIVDKDARKAYVIKDATVDTIMDIALGFSPIGDKLYEGDGKTPEGVYEIIIRKDGSPGHKSTFGLAFLINYPSRSDKAEFTRARNQGIIPSNIDSPGGEIEIHLGHSRRECGRDWTLGCIATQGMPRLMEEGFDHGTPIGIIAYLPDSVKLQQKVSLPINLQR